MKIAIGSDHAGFSYKQKLIEFLTSKGYDVINVGTDSEEQVDYPVYADKVCKLIEEKSVDTGILICGTGIGMSMAANKHKSIRAAVCTDLKSAEFTRLHNDANVLCMGERIIPYELAQEITEKYLTTEFLGGKHKTRIDMFSK
ncbi:ribose 5-phosphate isomerase B [Treponema bryantii]|uniref:ribose 5-phosphate isomerase B n=1 Tax=Treponema bryantii TaxID=163 RepID=UPI002B29B661|nr:ribose 5-phosphate isomerase B [Treponema bryantii]